MQHKLYSEESEKEVLGSIIVNPKSSLPKVEEVITEEHFYLAQNKKVFKALMELHNADALIDSYSLFTYFQEKNDIKSASYISLFENKSNTYNIDYYINILIEKLKLRNLNSTYLEIGNMIRGNEKSDEIMSFAEKDFVSISSKNRRGNLSKIEDVIDRKIASFKESLKNKNKKKSGIGTGFGNLDNIIYGFKNSNLIILGGRPSMGKTAFAMNLAAYMKNYENKKGIFFSLEMSEDQLVNRAISSEGRVNSGILENYQVREQDMLGINKARKKFSSEGDLYIEDTPGLTYADIKSIARRQKMKGGLDFVIIDHMHLVKVPKGKREDRRLQIAEIAREFKALAKELDIPVICLAQMSRDVTKRADKRPVLSDLKEASDIEENADLVMFIHRPEYYEQEKKGTESTTQIIVAKNRYGRLGVAHLTFRGHISRFEDAYNNKVA